MSQYLLELGMEEIPARFLLSLSEQLKERVEAFLQEERLTYVAVKSYATPRRLAVIVDGLSDKQDDLREKAKGPALKIARNAEGEWTKAALGFVKGQGADVADIVVESVNGEEYIFVDKFAVGEATSNVLSRIGKVVHQMTFPVAMCWNQFETPFIRPVHWIISLLENQVIPFEFVGVTAGNESRGHRFLGHNALIEHPNEYVEKLREQFVVVDFQERQKLIREQIADIAKEKQWHVPINEELLEEVTSIVEWPTAFYGEFEEKYLEVPQIVLITAMRDHQRYFYAKNSSGELLPVFISVRNGNAVHLENVIKGNRKVLRARLEDALFFYREDLKHSIDTFVEKLETVNEHFKLGTLADKQRRVTKQVSTLATLIQADTEALQAAQRASQIYKFDLMTQVVGEFDELQGQIGELYARHFGEKEAVANAIGTQYLPTTSGGKLPTTIAGAMLAFVDKLDTLIQYFSIDMIPSGSNDPYALRRQAMGLVEISLNQNWAFDLSVLLEQIVTEKDLIAKLVDFIKARVNQHLSRLNIDFDVIQAVLASKHLNVVRLIETARLLQAHKKEQPANYRSTVEALTRVLNLGSKVESENELDLTLAQTESERQLIQLVNALDSTQEIPNFYSSLVDLSTPIDVYFQENKVNADEEAIKVNRLETLRKLSSHVLTLMDPRELISKF